MHVEAKARMSHKAKFFQIGFNRCGTTAISAFFRLNGFSCIDWDQGRLARRLKKNHDDGRYILTGYEDFDVFTDMEYLSFKEHIQGFKYFPDFLAQVEGAKFILNRRRKDDWLASRLDKGDYAERYRVCHGLKDEAAVLRDWSQDWDSHHAAVEKLIPTDRLLIFDIDVDPASRLCEFGGLDASAGRNFTSRNFTLTAMGRLLARLTPSGLKRAVPDPIKQAIKQPFRKQR